MDSLVGRDSSGGIAARYGLNIPGIESPTSEKASGKLPDGPRHATVMMFMHKQWHQNTQGEHKQPCEQVQT